ncbi:MAG: PqqD family protein [Pseudomonadota bacterium]
MISQVWQRNENWVGSQIEDNFVMVNIDTGKYVSLNSSAGAVWQALEQPRTQAELESGLLTDYVVDAATCAHSISGLLEQMRELQLAAPN